MTSVKKRTGYFTAGLLSLILISVLAGRFMGREPVYQGKTVTEWVAEYGNARPLPTNGPGPVFMAMSNLIRSGWPGTNSGGSIAAPLPYVTIHDGATDTVVFAKEMNTQGATNENRLMLQVGKIGTYGSTIEPGFRGNFTVQAVQRPLVVPLFGTNLQGSVFHFYKAPLDPAVLAIKAIGAPAVPHLISALTRQENFIDSLREKLRRNSPPWILTNYLSAPVPAVRLRRNSAKLLGLIIDREATPAIPALIDALHDTDLEVRENAAFALGAQREAAKSAVPALLSAMIDNAHINEQAYPALQKIGVDSPETARTVNQWHLTRMQAASIASEILQGNKRDPESMESLGRLLSLWSGTKRHDLLYHLERGGPNAAALVPQLIGLLHDPDPETRYLTVRVLGAIGPAAKSALPELEKISADRSEQHALAAPRAIGQILEKPVARGRQ